MSTLSAPPAPASPVTPAHTLGGTGAIVPHLAGVPAERLLAAYEECRKITRTRARNFYHGLKLTPEPRRSAIYSIYAWMRAADDLVDSGAPLAERRKTLSAFGETTRRVLAGGKTPPGSAAFWTSFAATALSYPIDQSIFRDTLEGLQEDLDAVSYSTDEDLSRYCYRVAGTVGLACVAIWGLREGADPEKARQWALRRGQAFQRTNILRDLAEDLDATPSRLYIPADAFARHGVSPDELRAWKNEKACAALVLDQAAIAREHYTASEGLESLIDPACSPTLWAMTRIYAGILALIEENPRRVVMPARVRLRGTTKAGIAIAAALRARAGKW